MPSANRDSDPATTRLGPLTGLRAVTFDLFDTLVEIDMDRLPRLVYRGKSLRTSAPAVLERLAEQFPNLPSTELTADYLRITKEFWAEKEASGIELPARSRMERVLRHLTERSGRDPDDEIPSRALELVEIHMGLLADAVRPLSSALPLLRRLADDGVPLLLISNFDHGDTARAILERHGLAPFFQRTVISEDVGRRKPHRELFEFAWRALAERGPRSLEVIRPEDIAHVGDDPVCDVEGAGDLGWRTIWIDRTDRRTSDAAATAGPKREPSWRVSDLNTLLESDEP